jgi:hypothetical protein
MVVSHEGSSLGHFANCFKLIVTAIGTYWIVCRCYIRVVIDFRFRSFRNFLVLNFEVAWHDPQRRLKHLGLLSDMFEKFSRGT